MKIQFYLTNHINKAGEKPIRASISIKGTRLQKPIGYSVLPNKWDQASDSVEAGYTNSKGIEARRINRRIVNIGDALDIGVIWDGYDIVKTLSRIVSY